MKPRVIYRDGMWHCFDFMGGVLGRGTTPSDAYRAYSATERLHMRHEIHPRINYMTDQFHGFAKRGAP